MSHDVYYTAEYCSCIILNHYHQSEEGALFFQLALNSSPLSSHSSPLSAFLHKHMSSCLHRGALHKRPVIHLYTSLANCRPVGLFMMQRADCKQARRHVSQTAIKTPIGTHMSCIHVQRMLLKPPKFGILSYS